ncbi:MAG TPA: TMEM175 family protein [Marmoricola sp.]|nr:TMEM175 family protein [Marmoricola sp.]
MEPEQMSRSPHRGSDLHRFITFIDACVAIAITLLVLPLVEAAGDADRSVPLHRFLHEHQNLFFSFLLSFVVIATIWTGHHRYMSQVAAADHPMMLWILAWTLCLVLLPAPTALLSHYDSKSGTVPLYIGLLLISSLCSAGLAFHVSRKPELWAEGVTKADVLPASAIAMVACYVVALALGTLVPDVNFAALFLLFFAGPLEALVRRRMIARSVQQ